MQFTHTIIPDAVLIEPQVIDNECGLFMETWHADKFTKADLSLADDGETAGAGSYLSDIKLQRTNSV